MPLDLHPLCLLLPPTPALPTELQRLSILLLGCLMAGGVALDAFQTIILPRRPSGRFRITRMFYLLTWAPWVLMAERIRSRRVREQVYSVYGPVSLLFLLALWAILLTCAFGCVYFAFGTPFNDAMSTGTGFWSMMETDLYVSGTTLFTLGIGDVLPHSHPVRALIVLEAGTGLGFMALVIGYVPVLYQSFSSRETSVALLDGRAGSPPTATDLLTRHGHEGGSDDLTHLLAEWERWSAEILESHISYPILCYYRSQHDNQSWLSALVAVIDACALLITTVEGPIARQAQLTFAMGRHAVVDLGHVFHVEERAKRLEAAGSQRMPPEVFDRLCDAMGDTHIRLCGDPASRQRLESIRLLYEPHALALAEYLKMPLPLWVPEPKKADPWKTVSALRVERAAMLVSEHLSDHAVAASLHEEEHG